MDHNGLRGVLAEVRHDLGEARSRLQTLETLERYLSEKLGETAPPGVRGASMEQDGGDAIQYPDFALYTQAQGAELLLKLLGRPLTTIEMAESMIEHGYPHPRPAKLRTSLYTALLKNPQIFVRVSPGTWDLQERAQTN